MDVWSDEDRQDTKGQDSRNGEGSESVGKGPGEETQWFGHVNRRGIYAKESDG